MVDAVGDLLDAGRIKLYCVDSYDAASWSDRELPLEERARRHGAYESWILDQVVPWIHDDCGGPPPILTTGREHGRLPRRQLRPAPRRPVPAGLCLSGNYDPRTWHGWGEQGDALYFQNPTAYVAEPGRRPPGRGCATRSA